MESARSMLLSGPAACRSATGSLLLLNSACTSAAVEGPSNWGSTGADMAREGRSLNLPHDTARGGQGGGRRCDLDLRREGLALCLRHK